MCSDIKRVEKKTKEKEDKKKTKNNNNNNTKMPLHRTDPRIFPIVRRMTCNLSATATSGPQAFGAPKPPTGKNRRTEEEQKEKKDRKGEERKKKKEKNL